MHRDQRQCECGECTSRLDGRPAGRYSSPSTSLPTPDSWIQCVSELISEKFGERWRESLDASTPSAAVEGPWRNQHEHAAARCRCGAESPPHMFAFAVLLTPQPMPPHHAPQPLPHAFGSDVGRSSCCAAELFGLMHQPAAGRGLVEGVSVVQLLSWQCRFWKCREMSNMRDIQCPGKAE